MNIELLLEKVICFEKKQIKTEEIPFSEEVLKACEVNHCGRYGKSWVCPPAVGPLERLKKEVLEFEKAFIFTYKAELEDSFDIDGMNIAREVSQKILIELCDLLYENNAIFKPLGCGSCTLCSICSYPEKPCRFPEKAVVSMEACGIDVVSLSKKTGINYHNGVNTVTYFNMILF